MSDSPNPTGRAISYVDVEPGWAWVHAENRKEPQMLEDQVIPPEGVTALDGRSARCTSCEKEAPSSTSLPFFRFEGPGNGSRCDHCGWARCCHAKNATEFGALPNGEMVEWNTVADKPCHVTDHAWDDSAGREFDRFYCGCRGWD